MTISHKNVETKQKYANLASEICERDILEIVC